MTPASPTSPPVGDLVELATYHLTTGARKLYGQRVRGIVRVTDKPTSAGRSYLVERGLTSHAELQALVADYTAQSQLRDEPAAIVRIGEDLTDRFGLRDAA